MTNPSKPGMNPADLDALERIARNSKGSPFSTAMIPIDQLEALIALARASSPPQPSPASERWRPEVRAFADLMEAQLRANDHKPGWKGEDHWPLVYRLREETLELQDALAPGSRTDLPVWSAHVGREAADIANFAMMIADVCGALSGPSTIPNAEAADEPQPSPAEGELEAAAGRLRNLARDCDTALAVIGHASARRDIDADRKAIRTVLAALSRSPGSLEGAGQSDRELALVAEIFRRYSQPQWRDEGIGPFEAWTTERLAVHLALALAACDTPPQPAGQSDRERALVEAVEEIADWARAYPLDIFPEPDLKRAASVLKANGMTLDAISASNMRHVVTRVAEIAQAALAQPEARAGGEG